MFWLGRARGMKVINEGKCIGRVIQAELSGDMKALDGLWIDRALLGIRFINAEHICVFGTESVIVDNPGVHLRIRPSKLFVRAVTTGGKRTGAVFDAAIDEQTLCVKALALNKGWLYSVMKGPVYIYSYKYDPITSRVIIPEDISGKEDLP